MAYTLSAGAPQQLLCMLAIKMPAGTSVRDDSGVSREFLSSLANFDDNTPEQQGESPSSLMGFCSRLTPPPVIRGWEKTSLFRLE
jgi:hypothetical protein